MKLPLTASRLPEERREIYERTAEHIGGNPLHELRHIAVPNGCRIFAMEEFRNPSGSHYDRETLALLCGLEAMGEIEHGGLPLIETTTGSSGASLAWLARVLGFSCKILIPKDMPAARIAQIEGYGSATVQFAPELLYIKGLVDLIRTELRLSDDDFKYPNHSYDVDFGPPAFGEIGTEAIEHMESDKELTDEQRRRPDYFVCALGNGVSARGVADVLHPLGTSIVGMEPYESPDVLRLRFAEQYQAEYGNDFVQSRHEIYGTGPGQDADVDFPNVQAVAPLLDRIFLPKPEDWKPLQVQLMDLEARHVGNSSAACIWAALKLAEAVPAGSTILTIYYDAWWRYLPLPLGDERLNCVP
jgi:cysteine synthase